ncbi:uncharacterized protein LOC131941333 [Physella acuta]|uniref:uncharacterized protein LOC131941333 n=1 Tax=Physella acuta TaxID=109671 RepID=UPI0027DC9EF9|nr:uncharacterized protein LOC131941333 [Physella acuta]XP_059156527.1 uncharacterized protein LOC131941333 [Physella acuta]XP_059156528.1 uncharacterized protein LOC131941333 [Physella acuta]
MTNGKSCKNTSSEKDPHITEEIKLPVINTSDPKQKSSLPSKTLFGTVLERVDPDSLNAIDINNIQVKQVLERYPLPQHFKDQIKGREQLELSKLELLKQRQAVEEADVLLKSKIKQALSFRQAQNITELKPSADSVRLSHKDLEHSKEINSVGLNKHGSFNKDRYGSRPVRHKYSLIGDPLAFNMDFNYTSDTCQKTGAPRNGDNALGWNRTRHLPYDLMKQTQSKDASHLKSVIDLPPNIRHKFGSKVCDVLLSDQHLVSLSFENQKKLLGPARASKPDTVDGLPVSLEGNYQNLSHTSRYNTFPGLTTGYTMSQTKEDFNDSIHQRRVPNPDQYRYQRDELSTWAEHNILRERMKKAWNENHPLGGKQQ